MTRINAGVDPREMPQKMLLAEHREITRIPNAVKSGRAKLSGIPPTFRLGEGHVKFFYNKLLYLRGRYLDLLVECRRRGYNVTDKRAAFDGVPVQCCNNWKEEPHARGLILERIAGRHVLRTLEEIRRELGNQT